MEREITALRFQKRNKDRVNVYLDGEFAFGLAAIEAAHLRTGQKLGPADIEHLKALDEVEKAYERALNFLSYRPRSKAEIQRNLRKKGLDDEVIQTVIDRLERAGLLNDPDFARYWVENRVRFKPRGLRALRHELRQKGVSTTVIDQVLQDVEEESLARKAAEAGARRFTHLPPREFRRKMQGYLSRRGFSYPVIAPLLDALEERICGEDQLETISEENNNE